MYTATGTLDRQHYVEKFSPLVKRIAHHLMTKLPPSVDIGDMMQAGLIGLMDAVSRFEETQGAKFETYAAQRIRGAMLDELRRNAWVPRGVRKSQRQIDKAISALEQQFGRAPGENEIADEIGISLEEYRELLFQARGNQMLLFEDFDDGNHDSDFLERNCADEAADPLARLGDARFRAALVAAVEKLPEREKMLMGMYYEQELNFKEIAAVLGVTESRVCQLHGQAVSRLRVTLKDW
ncbi:MAG: RNA polymerase sigma factor FliA [Betaproteobacteria bacterium]|nr:RNA polymerase sigma factor FliA [Betaproteobacteria bacterium]